MKKFLLTILITITTLFVGCSEPYVDTDIRNQIEDLEGYVSVLVFEKLCKEMNSNISAIQAILNAVQNDEYVTAVNPMTEDGSVIGYTISFTKLDPVTIYHGKDGKDGVDDYIPIIGVKQDTDSVYHWTLDGEWLTDEDGNRIKVIGTDGKDGLDGAGGVTPLFKIENNHWYISYNNGRKWELVGKAIGADGADGDSGIRDYGFAV